jgi:succinyl-CoA synthetase beta subunit
MKIHEYQAKDLLRRYGVAVPKGRPAFSIQEAEEAANWLLHETGRDTVVVKAQIHAGGRGKAGGVKVVQGAAAARQAAQGLLGRTLVTIQTGPEGKEVKRLLVEQGLDIARELYLGMTLDRTVGRVTVMASSEGGVEIEEVARRSPEKILREAIDPVTGLGGWQARNLAHGLSLRGEEAKRFGALLAALTRLYYELDCSLVEVNPLVVTQQGEVLALDAKVTFDDNGLFRHRDLVELRDLDEEDPAETQAKKYDLSYIKLSGNIGCMVNGAGLAMSTMDIIKHFGGEPANFLDVGGGATSDKVAAAFKIITADPHVKGIFINIFGGIMKCDTLAEGVVEAVRQVGLRVPLVVRFEGTNVELGRKILAESGLALQAATDMADGARRIVELTRKS